MAGSSAPTMSVLDVFGDPLNRQILLLARDAPISARGIAAQLDVTLPTVYRRTDRLVEHDLLGVHHQVDEDGNHFRTFQTGLRRIEIDIEPEGYNIDIQLRQTLTDAFDGLWTDMEHSTGDWRLGPSRPIERPRSDGDTRPT